MASRPRRANVRARRSCGSPLHAGLAGLAIGLACASTDPVLEKQRQYEALRAARGACYGEAYERCYSGPEGTQTHGACRAGQRECQDGLWGPCVGEQTPTPELCNGIDDDCDGIVDNGYEREGALCFASNTQGACRSQGRWHCAPDGHTSICDAPHVEPTPERCDGIDNDCDGRTDEDAIPPHERTCTTGRIGVCASGTRRCVNATVRCVQDTAAGVEVCNGLDDDCDGEIDDQCVAPSELSSP